MRVQHNIMAMNAYRNYNTNNSALSKNLEKLSSGYKINRAGDDAAGLAISEKMRAQITGLDTAQNNAQDGISLVQTAEGALTEVHDMLNRMYELANKSANGTYETSDRNEMQKEINELTAEIDRISETANFNGIKLLNGTIGRKVDGIEGVKNSIQSITISGGGSGTITGKISASVDAGGNVTISAPGQGGANVTGLSWQVVGNASVGENGGTVTYKAVINDATMTAENKKLYEGMTITVSVGASDNGTFTATTLGGAVTGGSLKLQVGDDGNSNNALQVSISSMDSKTLGLDGLDVTDQDNAIDALATIKNAINQVSGVRGTLGATQNRLEHTINNLAVNQENIQNAESAIRDTDVADEMMNYTKNNILIQSAQAMLAQANQVPQGVLQLLQ